MKVSRVVEVALNGDAPQVDPAVRRTLYSMADALDQQNIDNQNNLKDEVEKLNVKISSLDTGVKSLRRLLIGTTSTVLGGVVIGIINILITI